jgi:hypothetical protein
MTVATITVWIPVLDAETREIIHAHGQSLADQGKTDNVKQNTLIPDGVSIRIPDGVSTRRTWATVEDAEEWVEYIKQFNPASVTIETTPA